MSRFIAALSLPLSAVPGAAAANVPLDHTAPCVPASDDRCESWVAYHGGATVPPGRSGKVEARRSIVSPDGSTVFMAGRAFETGLTGGGPMTARYIVVAYDAATGSTRWATTYQASGQDCPDPTWGYWDTAAALQLSPAGDRLFVTGRSCSDGGRSDIATVALDPLTGARLWVARFNHDGGTSWDSGIALTLSPDGSRVYVGGTWDQEPADLTSPGGPTLVAYDAVDGSQEWVDHGPDVYVEPGGGTPIAMVAGPALDPDEDEEEDWLYVLGRGLDQPLPPDPGEWVGIPETPVLSAYRGDSGELVWRRFFHGRMASIARALVIGGDGARLFFSAWDAERFGSIESDLLTRAVDAKIGAQLWSAAYDSPGDESRDETRDMTLSPDGTSVYTTGFSISDSSPRYSTITVSHASATGAQQWVSVDRGPPQFEGQDALVGAIGFDVAANPVSGRVYVAATSYVGKKFVHKVTALDPATGARVWMGTLDEDIGPTSGPGNWFEEQQVSMPSGLQVDPTGRRVFAVGMGRGVEALADPNKNWVALTVAYDA